MWRHQNKADITKVLSWLPASSILYSNYIVVHAARRDRIMTSHFFSYYRMKLKICHSAWVIVAQFQKLLLSRDHTCPIGFSIIRFCHYSKVRIFKYSIFFIILKSELFYSNYSRIIRISNTWKIFEKAHLKFIFMSKWSLKYVIFKKTKKF